MVLRSIAVLTVLLVLLTMVACGGDDDSSNSSAPSNDAPAASGSSATDDNSDSTDDEDKATDESDESNDESGSPGGGDAIGSIEVDGQTFDVQEMLRCEPSFDGEDNLDLQASGIGLRLFIYINTPLGSANALVAHELSIQGSAIGSGGQTGVFSGAANSTQGGPWLDEDANPLPGPPFTVAGDRVSGSLILADARGGAETIDVSFDVPIPSEVMDCSL